jgi:transcriptional regulator of acetoin/glycerol metabolism
MPNRDPRLRESLNALLVGSSLVVDVRQDILASWGRAARASLLPEALTIPYDPDVERGSRLQREATPIMDLLATKLVETGTALVLTDAEGRVADRRVSSPSVQCTLDSLQVSPGFSWKESHAGTNAIGTSLAQRRPVVITGGEHFGDAFVELACAGVPITDPRDGLVLGSISIATGATNASPLMLSFVNLAAWEIEQRVLQGSPLVERLLYQHFLRARRRTKRPVVVVGEHTMMTNAAAQGLLPPDERERVWDWALRALGTQTASTSAFPLVSGLTAIAECEAIYDGEAVVGAIIRLSVDRDASTASGARLGWDSLSDAERRVADLVAEGYTNREAAAKLFLSRYTVDAHLRHIYAKLAIDSRVALTRIAAEHSAR